MKVLHFALFISTFFVSSAHIKAEDPKNIEIDYTGETEVRGLVFNECKSPVHKLQLKLKADKNGEAEGSLILDQNQLIVDEFGQRENTAIVPSLNLDCKLTLIKTKKILVPDIMIPIVFPNTVAEAEIKLYEISGPKITSKLTLAVNSSVTTSARFIVTDKDGKSRMALTLAKVIKQQEQLFPPCHPGCFPASTSILIPDGATVVEKVKVGDWVTTINKDGKTGKSKVSSIFVTDNKLYDVVTDGGKLTTTETQPLALASGELKAAGDLKVGDKIFTWDGKQRITVLVKSVTATGKVDKVYNLILGEPELFVAGGFLARSKPPEVKK